MCEICGKEEQRIKRLSFNGHHLNSIKLKGASSIRKDERKHKKALRLNGLY